MDSFAKMDIFFIVTTVAVVLGSIAAIIITYYLVRILRSADKIMSDAKDVAHEAKEASEQVFDDIHTIRHRVAGAVSTVARLAGIVSPVKAEKRARSQRKVKNTN